MVLNRTRFDVNNNPVYDTEEFETFNEVHNYMSAMYDSSPNIATYRRNENKDGTLTWELIDSEGAAITILKYTNI